MTVIEEIPYTLPRQREIVEYERAASGSLAQCWERLQRWFASDIIVVGRGANHVFVAYSDPVSNRWERILLITR